MYVYLKPNHADNPPPTGVDAMWLILSKFVEATWTVSVYGNGSAAAVNGAPADKTFLTTGANAFFAVQMPGSSRTLVFKRGASDYLWSIEYALGGVVASGTGYVGVVANNPAAPTTQDLVGLFGNWDGAFNRVPKQFFPESNKPYKLMGAWNNAAPYDVHFEAVMEGGEQGIATALRIDPMLAGTYNAEDPDPYMLNAHFALNWAGAGYLGGAVSWGVGGLWGWYNYGTQSQRWMDWGYNAENGFPNDAGLNCWTGDVDFEAMLVSQTTYGRKGRSTLVRMRSVSMTIGKLTDYEGGTGNLIALGDYCLPWDNTAILAML